jgi:archaellum component FlaC
MQNQVKQLTMMQDEVKRLSKKIKELKVDEELRLLKEFNIRRAEQRRQAPF